MTIENIALRHLVLSPLNVRKTRAKETIESYAASILAVGILQNFRVHTQPEGLYGVVIGGTRLAALQLLLKQKKITEDYPVPCEVRPSDDPTLTEVSLAENIVREAMHPADEFDAFKKLADEGQGPEAIAARFGTTALMVKQRLKLAVVSPKLIAHFRKGDMTLDQLMAFTISDNHKAQEKVWRELQDWQKRDGEGRVIRDQLTEQHVASDSKLAKFIGVQAYEGAGGAVLRDLFDGEDKGYLTDTALLNRLVTERMELAAQPIRAEGWKFVDLTPIQTYEERDAYGHIYPKHAKPTAEQKAEAAKLQTEADAIMEKHGEQPEDEDAYARLEVLQEQIDALSEGEEVWTDEQKAVAGVILGIGREGELSITRGAVKPEDKAAMRRLGNGAGQGGKPGQGKAAEKPKGGLPASLIAELTSHKTVAAQLMLAQTPAVALIAVTHALAVRLLYQGYGLDEHSNLGISGKTPTYSLNIREQIEKSPAAKKLAVLVKSWKAKLPKKPEDLWTWMSKQKPPVIQQLLAVCAALTVDVVQSNGADATPAAQELTKAVKLNMADHWVATADNYFTRVPKKHLLDELGAAITPTMRKQFEAMKREPMAKAITAVLKGKNWIPPILKVG